MSPTPSLDALTTLVAQTADSDEPTARLRRALAISRQLADRGDELIEYFVADARAAGASWTAIGQAFGTSKQAAQKRYGTRTVEAPTWSGRWAPGARRALDAAAEHARGLGHTAIGTEHVLLGLLEVQDGTAAAVLDELGVTGDRILAQSCIAPCKPQAIQCLGVMPRLKRALELAMRIADRHGYPGADTEHLLAAITQVPDALALELLDRVGISAGDVTRTLAHHLDVDPGSLQQPAPRRRRRLRTSSR